MLPASQPPAQQRADQLLALARARFDPTLRPIEEQVLTHSCGYDDPPEWTPLTAPDTDPAALPAPHDEAVAPDNPPPPDRSPTGRPLSGWQGPELRPALLRWLLTDPAAIALLEPRGVRVWSARLTEPLDLTGCRISARLEFRYCLFEAAILLEAAELPSLTLGHATLEQGLLGSGLRLHGALLLEDVVAAGLNLDAATIEGNAQLANTTLTGDGNVLSLASAAISHDLTLWPAFASAGTVFLRQVHISGSLLAAGAKLTATGTSLDLIDATISGGVYLHGGFQAAGELQMLNMEIGGQMNCTGAQLSATGDTLSLDRARIQGHVMLVGVTSAGTIRMNSAEIGGQINCEGATFTATKETLILSGARIRDAIFFRKNFTSAGTILMRVTEISGTLECDGAQLTADKLSMILEDTKIRGSVFLRDGFRADGLVQFNYVEIGGQLIIDDASIAVFDSLDMQVGGDFFWTAIRNPTVAVLGLNGATVKGFRDDKASWPAPGHLFISGISIRELRLHDSRTDEERAWNRRGKEQALRAADRIAWLNLQGAEYLAEPQPWLFLAGMLDDKGQKREGRRVILELRRHQAQARWSPHPLLRRLAILFARLEEQPLRVLYPILLLTTLAGLIFFSYRAHFAETSESAYRLTHSPQPAPAVSSYPRFQPFVYALEDVLPVVKLGQDDHWAPDPAHTTGPLYRTLIAIRWFLILSGWVLGGILGAAVGARFRS